MSVRAIGGLAREALIASNGAARPVPGFDESPYRLARDEVIWIGANPRAMHPRMVVVDALRSGALALTDFDRAPWEPAALSTTSAVRLRARGEAFRTLLLTIEAPRGFGCALAGLALPFPLALADARLDALADAYVEGDEAAIEDAAVALLGIGTGLTPSGDDLVGGFLFAARMIVGGDATPLAERLVLAAKQRTHRISAALFADLARGTAYGWLHDIAAIVAGDGPIEAAREPARSLTAVGHSSGWDMLTGFILGATQRLRAPSLASS